MSPRDDREPDTQPDTQKAATEALERHARNAADESDNEIARSVLTSAFPSAVADRAWRFQFDEDRSGFQREIKALIKDAIDLSKLGQSER